MLSFTWDAASRQFLPKAYKTDGEVFKQYNVFRLKEKLHSPTLVRANLEKLLSPFPLLTVSASP